MKFEKNRNHIENIVHLVVNRITTSEWAEILISKVRDKIIQTLDDKKIVEILKEDTSFRVLNNKILNRINQDQLHTLFEGVDNMIGNFLICSKENINIDPEGNDEIPTWCGVSRVYQTIKNREITWNEENLLALAEDFHLYLLNMLFLAEKDILKFLNSLFELEKVSRYFTKFYKNLLVLVNDEKILDSACFTTSEIIIEIVCQWINYLQKYKNYTENITYKLRADDNINELVSIIQKYSD